ncbi:hypothetical protein [Gottfriedia solisilvae]|uniref:hypothetical protein n=1 Tax=Gottfriedia solisilvae TaxID=1516104 RepID=UPI003D2F022A
MISKEKGIRKKRKDTKYEIKPTIPLSIKQCLARISFITNKPIKDIGEEICIEGIYSREIIELLSQFFVRDYWHKSTFILGNNNRTSLQNSKLSNKNERISLKIEKELDEKIKDLAYALDVTPSKATAILIDCTIKHSTFISSYIKTHTTNELDYEKMLELRNILAFMNHNKPRILTWGAFISYLYGKVKDDKVYVSEEIMNWIKKFE